jgi:hypothetical protein
MTRIQKKLKRKPNLFAIFLVMCLSLFILFHSVGHGQEVSGVGTTAAAFLKIGVGARALAMGEAQATLAEDITAMFWNPAGLSQVDRIQVLLNHYDYIADLTYDYAGVAIPIPFVGTVGAFFSYLGMPDIERTTLQMPDGNGEMVSANSFSAGFSYARALTDRFSIGGSAKYIRETIWHCHSSGFALDIGVLYRTFFKNIRIGMSISNFGTDMKMDGRDLLVQHDIDELSEGNNANINANLATEAFRLPILFRVGLSANLTRDFIGLQQHDLTFAVDAVHPNDNREYLNIGAEYRFRNFIALRAGHRQVFLDNREGGLTFGFGLNVRIMSFRIILDYASVDFGRLDNQNKFSLIMSF